MAQSSFNVEKITEIQNRFAGGEVRRNAHVRADSDSIMTCADAVGAWEDLHKGRDVVEKLS